MKWNKIFLRICHFFGFKKDTVHMDDIMFRINHFDDGRSIFLTNDSTIMLSKHLNDIKKLIYEHIENNQTFNNKCNIVNQVCICFANSEVIYFDYIDDVLYYSVVDRLALERAKKLKELGL